MNTAEDYCEICDGRVIGPLGKHEYFCDGHPNRARNRRKRDAERRRCLDGTATESMLRQHRNWLAKVLGQPGR